MCKFGFYIPTHNNLDLQAIEYISTAIKYTILDKRPEESEKLYNAQLKIINKKEINFQDLITPQLKLDIMNDKIYHLT